MDDHNGLDCVARVIAQLRAKRPNVHAAIRQLNSQRQPDQKANDVYTEYKGVIHVHSFLGGHSTGTFEDIVAAATANQLNFAVGREAMP